MGDFYGKPTRAISNDYLEVEYLESAGPRIVGLRYRGSANLLAHVPGEKRDTPWGEYLFMGGHRLWHSPEEMPRTYVPDNDGCTCSQVDYGVLLEGRLEEGSGIRKRIEIRVDPACARVHLMHTLVNEGLWDVRLAPWAITMFRLGGLVTLPLRAESAPRIGLLPDRSLVFWPYTKIHDKRLKLSDDFVQIDTQPGDPIKIGMFNPCGWISYQIDGILFRKSFDVRGDEEHTDFGCNAESYSGSDFVELESLGPLSLVPVGGKVQWQETWELSNV